METGDNNTNTGTPTVPPTPVATPTPAAGGAVTAPEKNTLMAVLAYLGILIIIPFLVAKDNAFVKFHLKQGLVLFTIEAILWVVGMGLMWGLYPLLKIVHVALIILSIIGIINALQGKEKELPLIGQFSKHFTL